MLSTLLLLPSILGSINDGAESYAVKKRVATKDLKPIVVGLALTTEEAAKVMNSDVWHIIHKGELAYEKYATEGMVERCQTCNRPSRFKGAR
jgi:hypothetical protein